MSKIKKCDGFLGCRTPKEIENKIKTICKDNNKEVSEVINYLFRIFIEDIDGIRTKFLTKKEDIKNFYGF